MNGRGPIQGALSIYT